MFAKIFVALDGSQPSLDALDYALTIAEKCGSTEVQLVHVIPHTSAFIYTGSPTLEPCPIGLLDGELGKKRKKILRDAQKKSQRKKSLNSRSQQNCCTETPQTK